MAHIYIKSVLIGGNTKKPDHSLFLWSFGHPPFSYSAKTTELVDLRGIWQTFSYHETETKQDSDS